MLFNTRLASKINITNGLLDPSRDNCMRNLELRRLICRLLFIFAGANNDKVIGCSLAVNKY